MMRRSSRPLPVRLSRMTWWLGIALTLVSLAAAACSAPSSPDQTPRDPGVPPATATVADLVEATNAERARAGIAALSANSQLMQAAQIQAEQVAAAGRLDHNLPGAPHPGLEDRLRAADYFWKAAGENLAFGQRNAAHAVDTWMKSPTHRANILSATFTEVGAGYVVDPLGRPYYVQVFGRPR